MKGLFRPEAATMLRDRAFYFGFFSSWILRFGILSDFLIQHPVLIGRPSHPLFKQPGKMLGIFET